MVWLGLVLFVILPGLVVLEILRCVYLEYRTDRIPILLYHRLVRRKDIVEGVVPDAEPVYVSYDDVFAEQMQYLHDAGYTTLTFDDYLAIREKRRPMPHKPVLLTFDDGYLSSYTIAWPILRRLGLCGTDFVPPLPNEETREYVRGMDDFLSAAQMQELERGGIRIESHTLTHCVLAQLDQAAAQYELKESRRLLEEITGRPIRHLAVPRAGYSRNVRRLAIEAGYQTVCCNNKGTATGLSDRFALPRIVIERDMNVRDFRCVLEPRHAIMARLLGNLKRIPERLCGARGAAAVRGWIMTGPLHVLLVTRQLRRITIAAASGYVTLSLLFVYWWAIGRKH
jgi:peptidoglycan/xylan/chitin deacetylase (PgdA/CDA1 family)